MVLRRVSGPLEDDAEITGEIDFISSLLIYTKFYSQKSEWDWTAGIAYFSPLPTARSRLYTLYKYYT